MSGRAQTKDDPPSVLVQFFSSSFQHLTVGRKRKGGNSCTVSKQNNKPFHLPPSSSASDRWQQISGVDRLASASAKPLWRSFVSVSHFYFLVEIAKIKKIGNISECFTHFPTCRKKKCDGKRNKLNCFFLVCAIKRKMWHRIANEIQQMDGDEITGRFHGTFLFYFFQIKLAPGGRVTWQTTARPSPLRLFFQDQGRPWSAIFPSPITCLITIINIFLRWTLESKRNTRISLTLGAHFIFGNRMPIE